MLLLLQFLTSLNSLIFPFLNTKVIIVPHYMINEKMVENTYYQVKNFHPQNIVIFSPNHFWKWEKNFESIHRNAKYLCWKNDCIQSKTLANEIIWDGINHIWWDDRLNVCYLSWDKCFIKDHGIWEHIKYIKKYFPKANVYPVFVRNSFKNDKKLIKYLKNKFKNKKTLFIFSVDMSHHNLENWAYLHDRKTIYTLQNSFEKQDYKNLEVDCPECLYIAKNIWINFQFLQRDSASLRFWTKGDNTSIMTFVSNIFPDKENGITIAFFGDSIYDRWIKYFFPSQEKFYFFLREFFQKNNINNNLRFKKHRKLFGLDFAGLNLETPVVDNKNKCQKTSKLVHFCSDAIFLNYLKNIWFNIISFANNHTMDGGISAFQNTLENLKKYNFGYFGYVKHWKYYKNNFVYTWTIRWIKYAWHSYDFTITREKFQSYCNDLKSYKWYLNFVVVHWGYEYQTKHNKIQENIAKKLIDCGANLIIWAHPHVIQDIWYYKNVPIIYSLGNFIFDQFKIKNGNIWAYVLIDISDKGKIRSLKIWKFDIKTSGIKFR